MKKIFYGWWIVVASFFIGLYKSSVIFFGFTAFVEPIIQEFGWSYTQVSFAASLRGLEMGIFSPVVGFLVDRFGCRILILVGSLIVGFALLLMSYTHSLAMFYVSFLLLAFGAGGCAGVVLLAAVANWFQRNVGKAFGIVAAGIGASGLLIPLIVGMIDSYGWRTALVILAVGMWIIGIPLSLVLRHSPEKYGYLPDGDLAVNPLPSQERMPENGFNFKEALRDKNFLYLNLVEFIRHTVISAVVIHVMPYLSGVGMSRMNAGLVAAGIPIFSIIGRVGFGWIADVYDKRYAFASAFGLMSAGLLAFCYAPSEKLVILFLLLFPPGFGGGMVLRSSVVREYFGRKSFGKVIGCVMGTGSIGGVIGPTLAGWVFDTWGSYDPVWFSFIGLSGLASWLTLRMKTWRK